MLKLLESFDKDLFKRPSEEVERLVQELYQKLIHYCHCDGLNNRVALTCVFDNEDYLYKTGGEVVNLNLSMCKNFGAFGYLFVIDALGTIVRTQMQTGYAEFLAERAQNGGTFWSGCESESLPAEFAELFSLGDSKLLYASLEGRKNDWFSVTQFDRRCFAGALVLAFLAQFERGERRAYLEYVCDCFFSPDENAPPLTVGELAERVVLQCKQQAGLCEFEARELTQIVTSQAEFFDKIR